jgi:hypothetical protein
VTGLAFITLVAVTLYIDEADERQIAVAFAFAE